MFESLESFVFIIFSSLTIVACLVVVTTNNILYALTALASAMIFISVFFFILGAEFLGVVQIAVYTGAVIVMYAFALMFIDASQSVKENKKGNVFIAFCCVIFAAILTCAAASLEPRFVMQAENAALNDLEAGTNTFKVGVELFKNNFVAFEAAGVLLLVALIGGVALGVRAKKEKE